MEPTEIGAKRHHQGHGGVVEGVLGALALVGQRLDRDVLRGLRQEPAIPIAFTGMKAASAA